MNSIPYLLRLLFLLLCSRKALSEKHYDYVIVGGGTSGLALANRLSADQSIKVAVLEAGPSVLNDPNVQDPEVFFRGGNPSLHWNYTSKPQRHLGGRTINCTAAKALGGTSTINGK
jgi:choline dehydrogenase-like flavoprotein